MNQKQINEIINPEQNQIFNDCSSNILEKKKEENNKVDELDGDIEMSEKINNLQQQQYYQALDEVKTDIRVLCQPLYEQIQFILMIQLKQQEIQEIQEIILEFYKDVFYEKLMMDNLEEFSQDLIFSVWSKKYQEQVFRYFGNINFNDHIIT